MAVADNEFDAWGGDRRRFGAKRGCYAKDSEPPKKSESACAEPKSAAARNICWSGPENEVNNHAEHDAYGGERRGFGKSRQRYGRDNTESSSRHLEASSDSTDSAFHGKLERSWGGKGRKGHGSVILMKREDTRDFKREEASNGGYKKSDEPEEEASFLQTCLRSVPFRSEEEASPSSAEGTPCASAALSKGKGTGKDCKRQAHMERSETKAAFRLNHSKSDWENVVHNHERLKEEMLNEKDTMRMKLEFQDDASAGDAPSPLEDACSHDGKIKTLPGITASNTRGSASSNDVTHVAASKDRLLSHQFAQVHAPLDSDKLGFISISDWLRSIDFGRGMMQKTYGQAVEANFDDVYQIVDLYAKPDGVDQQFFDDINVVKIGHQRLFEKWFREALLPL